MRCTDQGGAECAFGACVAIVPLIISCVFLLNWFTSIHFGASLDD